MPRNIAALAASLLLAACATFPEIDALPPAAPAAPPVLVPIDTLLQAAEATAQPAAPTLAARAARLKARAARLRGPVLDPETGARLDAAARKDGG